jgi:hypothetical protein
MPRVYRQDLDYICKLYNARLRIGPGDSIPFHCYDRGTRTIHMSYSKDYPVITPEMICKVFTHELSHCIQHDILLEGGADSPEFSSLEDVYLYERAAERLAYFIYREYFSHVIDFKHQSFSAYLSTVDKAFLAFYYDNHINGSKEDRKGEKDGTKEERGETSPQA